MPVVRSSTAARAAPTRPGAPTRRRSSRRGCHGDVCAVDPSSPPSSVSTLHAPAERGRRSITLPTACARCRSSIPWCASCGEEPGFRGGRCRAYRRAWRARQFVQPVTAPRSTGLPLPALCERRTRARDSLDRKSPLKAVTAGFMNFPPSWMTQPILHRDPENFDLFELPVLAPDRGWLQLRGLASMKRSCRGG